jgi:hypothetical protein
MNRWAVAAAAGVVVLGTAAAACGDNGADDSLAHASSDGTFEITRLNGGEAVVSAEMILALGWEDTRQDRRVGLLAPAENLSGPSVIRIPDWITSEDRADPDAVYYMYFAHHHGQFLRVAWARDVEGPWTVHNMSPDVPAGDLGVLSIADGPTEVGGGLEIRPGECDEEDESRQRRHGEHVASPYPVIDDVNQEIVLYFHVGRCLWLDGQRLEGQQSLAAASPTGLDFNDGYLPEIIGPTYIRPFVARGEHLAVSGQAEISAPADPKQPTRIPEGHPPGASLWSRISPPNLGTCLFGEDSEDGTWARVRHSDIDPAPGSDGETLWWFYSVKGSAVIDGEQQPEQILFTELDPDADDCWGATWPPEVVISAVKGWECGAEPIEASDAGPSGRFQGPVNQLRDPDLFVDADGSIYLFYTGCGETGIGLAKLEPL